MATKITKGSKATVEKLKEHGKKAAVAKKQTGEFKVDATGRGGLDGTVSAQWAERPDDQKFTSLKALRDHVAKRQEKMTEIILPSTSIVADAIDEKRIVIKADGATVEPTNYGFGLLAYRAEAPAGYLRRLPAHLAAQCLNEGFRTVAGELVDGKPVGASQIKLYHDGTSLYSAMSSNFGRIYDKDVVEAVMKVAGNGTGDTRWKVPGVMNWGKGTYNPFVDITKDTTTLYASDRDIFLFLVDDTHPIEVGKLADGSPDYMFRGFYVWGSEMGGKSMGISTFMLRGVCQNRNLWGVEDQLTMTIRHTKLAPARFVEDFNKTLLAYSTSSDKPIIDKVKAAKKLVLATTDDERFAFLTEKIGLSRPQALATVRRVVEEEGRKPESAWDFAQGITALARGIKATDDRRALELKASSVMEKVKV